AEVVALVERDEKILKETSNTFGIEARFATLEEALEKVPCDAVVITTPTFTHRDMVVVAASAHKHVFCEKPMAISLEECDEMIAAAQQNGVFLQLGFMRRHDPDFVLAKERIDGGEIGEPMMIKSLTHGPGLPPPWAWNLKTSNGLLAEVNSHCWDSVRWLMGSNYQRVYAEIANFKGKAHDITDPDFYDNALVNIKFESGGLGSISGICPCDYGYDARVEIVGTKGIMQIGDMQGKALVVCTDRDHGLVTPIFRTWQQRHAQAYVNEMEHFVECVQAEKAPKVDGIDGRYAVAGVLAGTKSFMEQRPVYLNEILQEGA
ncbi:MAG TPA: Gfo/Idh/MocA family oxidoreductase, partial [Longilinea sp.]|nr:Gfo/Idh/MocA family oxidoreductase [Longilinea sp.]